MYYTFKKLEKVGRLGNQLWQIASTIGEAEERGEGLATFKPSWPYRSFFNIPERMFTPAPNGEELCDMSALEDEYLQKLKYFKGCKDQIWDWFQPSHQTDQAMADIFEELTDDTSTYVSLHVRRGDYLNHTDLFTHLSPDYYRRAMDKQRELQLLTSSQRVKFLVFSDDPDWCSRNFAGEEFTVVRGSTTPTVGPNRNPLDYVDMMLMSRCEGHIIANSSFSWWGAWLGTGPVVYPSRWFEGDHLSIPWRDMIPDENWYEVEA
jgi:hypothetical protein